MLTQLLSVGSRPIPYEKFRTGLTYQEVSDMLWSYNDDSRTWHLNNARRTKGKRGKNINGRRHAILGKWKQIKQEMYQHYLQTNFPPEVVPTDLPF